MSAVSRARVIVEHMIPVYGKSSSASRWPVRSACRIPGHIMQLQTSSAFERYKNIPKTKDTSHYEIFISKQMLFILPIYLFMANIPIGSF